MFVEPVGGSDFGLDKSSSYRLLIDLVDEGYLDAEYHTSDSEVVPLRYVEIRNLIDKAFGELPSMGILSKGTPEKLGEEAADGGTKPETKERAEADFANDQRL